jgi:hypothetical protein
MDDNGVTREEASGLAIPSAGSQSCILLVAYLTHLEGFCPTSKCLWTVQYLLVPERQDRNIAIGAVGLVALMSDLLSEHSSVSDERTHGQQVPTFSTPLSRTERQASDGQLYGARSFRLPSEGLE